MTTPELESFYVAWSEDEGTYQMLGTYDATNAKNASEMAAANHRQPGRYLVMPDDKVSLFNVSLDVIPVAVKVTDLPDETL